MAACSPVLVGGDEQVVDATVEVWSSDAYGTVFRPFKVALRTYPRPLVLPHWSSHGPPDEPPPKLQQGMWLNL